MKKRALFSTIAAGGGLLFALTLIQVSPLGFKAANGAECKHVGYHYEAREATCQEPGNKEFWTCCICNQVMLEQPSKGTFTNQSISKAIDFDEFNPAFIPLADHRHGTSGTTITSDGMFDFECLDCHEHVQVDTYECSKDVVELIQIDRSYYQNVRWFTVDVSNPISDYTNASKDQYGNAWSVGIMQKLSWESFDDANGYPFSICQHPNDGGSYLAQFTDGAAFTSGNNDFSRGFKWLTEIDVSNDDHILTNDKITLGLAYKDGGPSYGILKDLGGTHITTGDFSSAWSGSYPCAGITGLVVNRDVTLSNIDISTTEPTHLVKYNKFYNSHNIGDETGLTNANCEVCGEYANKITLFGPDSSRFIGVDSYDKQDKAAWLEFHVDKPYRTPDASQDNYGPWIINTISGWNDFDNFNFGFSYISGEWNIGWGRKARIKTIAELGLSDDASVFPEEGIDIAVGLVNKGSYYDAVGYYRLGGSQTWTKYCGFQDVWGEEYSIQICRLGSNFPIAISDVFCSATTPTTAKLDIASPGQQFVFDTAGSYTYSADFTTNTSGDSDSGLIIKDANGQEIKISVRLQGSHLLCLTAITSDEDGNHKLDYFTPYFQGMTGLTPSIGDFTCDLNPNQSYSVKLEYDNANKEFALYLNSVANGEVKIKTWTINDLETDIHLTDLDFSSGSIGVCARDCGSSYTATITSMKLESYNVLAVRGFGMNQKIKFNSGDDIEDQIDLPSISRYQIKINNTSVKDFDEELDFDFTTLTEDSILEFVGDFNGSNVSYSEATKTASLYKTEFGFLENTTGSYTYSADFTTNTSGDSDSGLIIKDANGQEIKISVRLQGSHLLCLTAITSDESGDHKLDYFTPYFQGMTGLTPSIGDFTCDLNPNQSYSVKLEYDNANKEFAMYLTSEASGSLKIKTWSISQLETDIHLTDLDFSSGSIGVCARDTGDYSVTVNNMQLDLYHIAIVRGCGVNQTIQFDDGEDIKDQINSPTISRYQIYVDENLVKDFDETYEFTSIESDTVIEYVADLHGSTAKYKDNGTCELKYGDYVLLENTNGSFAYTAKFDVDKMEGQDPGFYLRDKNGNDIELSAHFDFQNLWCVTGIQVGGSGKFDLTTKSQTWGDRSLDDYRCDYLEPWHSIVTMSLVYDDIDETLSLVLDSTTSGLKNIKTWDISELASSLSFSSLDLSSASIGFINRDAGGNNCTLTVSDITLKSVPVLPELSDVKQISDVDETLE